MTANCIDFTAQATVFWPDLALSNGSRRGASSHFGGEIARQVMTETGPDATKTDRHRSALMAAAQSGDGVSYQALLRDCIPVIKAIARRRGIAADRIDDVVQDVLLTIHRARQTYDPNRSFTAWLSVIAERRAIDLIRRTRRQHQREVYAPFAFESHADESTDPSRGIALVERRSAIASVVKTLPRRQREAISHFLFEEHCLADAAAVTRRSKGSLKVNLHRALKALRAKMERGL
jgi:RNA polymerase sigma-70 factor (ECF subfamily)